MSNENYDEQLTPYEITQIRKERNRQQLRQELKRWQFFHGNKYGSRPPGFFEAMKRNT